MKVLMKMIIVMMKIDIEAAKIQAAAAVDSPLRAPHPDSLRR
jgi:hypothetical protein